MGRSAAWIAVAGVIALTVYGQLAIKWRMSLVTLPQQPLQRLLHLALKLLDPWVASALAGAFVAALLWMAAMTRLPLSQAYPLMSLSFVLVAILSAFLLHEGLPPARLAGIALIMVGVFLIAR